MRQHRHSSVRFAAIGLCLVGAATAAAQSPGGASPAPGEAWRSSPHHGQLNGATDRPIPCLCRFKGRDFGLGEAVCMNTHVGTVIAKCDLVLNNTTWAPTSEPCTVSSRPQMSPIPRG